MLLPYIYRTVRGWVKRSRGVRSWAFETTHGWVHLASKLRKPVGDDTAKGIADIECAHDSMTLGYQGGNVMSVYVWMDVCGL